MDFQIEQFVVHAVKDRLIQARLSHRDRAVFFGTNVFASQAAENDEGPQLQVRTCNFLCISSRLT